MNELIDGMPRLIQAGMGVHISSARLANATARLGALGVVSGAGLRHVVVEDIRAGDPEATKAALSFPLPRYIDELMAFAPGGPKFNRPVPLDSTDPRHAGLAHRLSAIGAFVEVVRARQGHRGRVGINVMWKCGLTVLPSIYGAMIAGVDALLCGAGVPMELPDIVSRIQSGEDMDYRPLTGTGTHAYFEIADDCGLLPELAAPRLMPILSNYAFARRMCDVWEKTYGGARPFAFVLENHQAGGHNAPPRNREEFAEQDDIDSYFDKVVALGLPVYVAGAFPGGGNREDYLTWRSRGAYGIQIGSRFALCTDSGMRQDIREEIIAHNRKGDTQVRTSLRMSPTGYPLKYLPASGTMAEEDVYSRRRRLCNRGYLLQSHFETAPDGTQSETYICPAMPAAQFVKRGGQASELEGRVCLCNGLFSTAGYYNDTEMPLVTLGESGIQVKEHLSARQVVEEILTTAYVAERERELG